MLRGREGGNTQTLFLDLPTPWRPYQDTCPTTERGVQIAGGGGGDIWVTIGTSGRLTMCNTCKDLLGFRGGGGGFYKVSVQAALRTDFGKRLVPRQSKTP